MSALSLKYYGICLQEGYYNISLHFAELVLIDSLSSPSVGRRIFDVFIQGKKVLANFDIAKEAKGVNKGIVRNFTTLVNNPSHTLEIHLYWGGKGTTYIPKKGVYGPLISAISITPNFNPNLGVDGLPIGAMLGIVFVSCSVVIICFALVSSWLFFKRSMIRKETRELKLLTCYYSWGQIKAATMNFDSTNIIGEGGFGPVYKGKLQDGSMVAVKLLSSMSKQGNREFINEVGMISALQHSNLVKLFGCCVEGQLSLVYEYMENNSLAHALFDGPEEDSLNLDWPTRYRISLGIAKGLAYLHDSRLKIVHRDIKASNILLDKNLNPKISDFGLAKLNEGDKTRINTRIIGTLGYIAPEYAMRGLLTNKADVYSYGIVLLEIVSGLSNTSCLTNSESVYLLDWAYVLQKEGNLLRLIDPRLRSDYVKDQALLLLNLALLCTNPSSTLRPSMTDVVKKLEGQTTIDRPPLQIKPT